MCGVCLHLNDTVPAIMQGNIYCNMSVTSQLHVNLLITTIPLSGLFFPLLLPFEPDELSGNKSKNTHPALWIVNNSFRRQESKQQMTKQTFWRAYSCSFLRFSVM